MGYGPDYLPLLDDLDVQERAGLVGVWLTPSAEGQMPCVSLELLGGQKRYLRVWLDGRDRMEWGWVLNDKAVCVWRDDEFASRSGEPPPPAPPAPAEGGGTQDGPAA